MARTSGFKKTAEIAVLALGMAALSGGAAAQLSIAGPALPGGPLTGYGAVSAEFQETAEIEAALPLLAEHGVGLVLDWPASQVEDPARFELVRRANALGVLVAPWLVLSEEQGYWANSTNAVVYDEAARRLIDAWLRAGLRPTIFAVDMEMSIARTRRFAELATALDGASILNLFQEGIDRAQYAEATRVYRDLVDYAHARGFLVGITTLAMVLDDYADGDDGLRQALNIPVDGIAWDTLSFQLYRTLNQLALGAVFGPTTSYYVYAYAKTARALFGARAGVGVGMLEPGDLMPGATVYSGPEELRDDVDAALAAGISREAIGVYNLRGILDRPPSEQWFPSPSWWPLPPPADLATTFTMAASKFADLFL